MDFEPRFDDQSLDAGWRFLSKRSLDLSFIKSAHGPHWTSSFFFVLHKIIKKKFKEPHKPESFHYTQHVLRLEFHVFLLPSFFILLLCLFASHSNASCRGELKLYLNFGFLSLPAYSRKKKSCSKRFFRRELRRATSTFHHIGRQAE